MQIATTEEKKWTTTRKASDCLGVSESTLYLLRKKGILKPNIDWRRKFPSSKSGVLYDLKQCEKTLKARFEADGETLELAFKNQNLDVDTTEKITQAEKRIQELKTLIKHWKK